MTQSQLSLRLAGSFGRSGAGPCSISGISRHCEGGALRAVSRECLSWQDRLDLLCNSCFILQPERASMPSSTSLFSSWLFLPASRVRTTFLPTSFSLRAQQDLGNAFPAVMTRANAQGATQRTSLTRESRFRLQLVRSLSP